MFSQGADHAGMSCCSLANSMSCGILQYKAIFLVEIAGNHQSSPCAGTPDPLWVLQRSAANRVSRLAENDESLQDLIAAGVCPRLLAMLKAGVDPGM